MYNEDLKKDFIESYVKTIKHSDNNLVVTATKHRLQHIFEAISEFETKLNKDFSNFSREQIFDLWVDLLDTIPVATLKSYSAILFAYRTWITASAA